MGWADRTGHKGEPKPPSDEISLALDTQKLQGMASQIENEQHLQAILETVTDSALRSEIERLLRPMLLFDAPKVGTDA